MKKSIEFTKEQYEYLIKQLYLGNWMINSFRTSNEYDKFDELENYVYSFAKDFGMESYIEYDRDFKKYFPTSDFDEDPDIQNHMDEYDNNTFWDELIRSMAGRDFVREYGQEAIRKMSWDERARKEQPFLEKYGKEFEVNGIDNLKIV